MPSNPNGKRAKHIRRMNRILTREFLEREFNENKLTAEQIAKKTRFKVYVIRNRLKKLRILKEKVPPRDLRNQKFGKLRVLNRPPKYGSHDWLWLCECDCGRKPWVYSGNLRRGSSKTCGCSRGQAGKYSTSWKGCDGLSGTYWRHVVHGAEARDLQLEITIEDAWKQFVKQGEKCALTGWKIELAKRTTDTQTASLDRIDSNKHYTVDNIQWVHKDVNRMKQYFDEEYLLQMATAVVEWHKSNK